MPLGVIVRSSSMVDVSDEELGKIIKFRVPSIEARRQSGDESCFYDFVGLLSGVNR